MGFDGRRNKSEFAADLCNFTNAHLTYIFFCSISVVKMLVVTGSKAYIYVVL